MPRGIRERLWGRRTDGKGDVRRPGVGVQLRDEGRDGVNRAAGALRRLRVGPGLWQHLYTGFEVPQTPLHVRDVINPGVSVENI